MTRAEHMRWCKQRAHQAYDHQASKGDLAAALRDGVASMLSDLGKHEETAPLAGMAFLIALTVKDKASLDSFIDGFAE